MAAAADSTSAARCCGPAQENKHICGARPTSNAMGFPITTSSPSAKGGRKIQLPVRLLCCHKQPQTTTNNHKQPQTSTNNHKQPPTPLHNGVCTESTNRHCLPTSPSSEEEDEDEELEEEESARLQHQRREHCPVRDTDTHRRLYTHLRVKSMVLFMTSISTLPVDELREMRMARGRMKECMCVQTL